MTTPHNADVLICAAETRSDTYRIFHRQGYQLIVSVWSVDDAGDQL
jgi:hypothetical protein